MRPVNIILTGFGHVGRAFVRLLEEKRKDCRERYGLSLKLVAVFKSDGGLVSENRIALEGLADLKTADLRTHAAWVGGLSRRGILGQFSPGVLVECTPSNFLTGEPGLAYTRSALKAGWNVASASKGALVLKFSELLTTAKKKKVALKFSGAAAAALPTLDVGMISLAGAEIVSIEGILTGVTNYILTRMEEGVTFNEALRYAQDQGISEPDPLLDIDGWDSAAKILLISNAVAGTEFSLKDVGRKGIGDIRPEDIRTAARAGKRLKLLARFHRPNGKTAVDVRVSAIDPSHPLYHVSGTNKGITFRTDTMGQISVTGGKSDPRGTAAALLKDIINIYR